MKMTRRNFISTSAATMLACGVSLSAHAAGSESENGLNFITDIFSDPAKPGTTQDATPLTAEKNAEWYSKLDFSDRREFVNAERGMLDNAEETIIYNDDGTTAWDLPSYGDLSGDAPDTVNPSLWRNTQLNAKAGLYEVCNGIYGCIHNHVIFNSTALDGTKKFRNFFFSALAVQRLSDLICLEHQLSVIEKKPYRERQKRVLYPPKESNRDRLCGIIDTILAEKPKDFEVFLQKLEQQGYEAKRGKHTAVKGKGQKRFIRFRTLGTEYSEEEIKAVLEDKAKHQPYQRKLPKEQPFQLLVDIQGKMAEGKSVGYKRWATKFNLKEMSKTLLFLQEQKISSAEELRERAAAATERYHAMGDSIKAAETRLAEIAVLKTHIINYAKTRPVYDAYRKSGYSKKFLEAHREEITLHKAAKAAFDEAGLQKLPKVKELDAEFSELLTKKKAAYPDYRKARNEMQELVRAQKNVERFFAEEKDTAEKTQTR
jgi:hypothetical protein